jgi:hypothetical protein
MNESSSANSLARLRSKAKAEQQLKNEPSGSYIDKTKGVPGRVCFVCTYVHFSPLLFRSSSEALA